jgi:spermidine/putrescine transport system ATP-binding protein
MTSGDFVVQLDNVTKHYPGAASAALLPTSIEIKRGEFFSVLGPSGSGKTTTLRMIAGFETPDSGRVLLDGKDVTSAPPYHRNVSTVFQSYALFPHMTVEENVAFPLLMTKTDKTQIAGRVSEALTLVEMSAFGARYPHQMSGGQRQRIALARALVGRPSVLLLDEPLGALDLRLRQQMQHVLVKLQRELGLTFVYVTHDQGEALSMSNRVAVMETGRIKQLGSPHDIYFSPNDEFIARFIGKSNIFDIQVEQTGKQQAGVLGGTRFALPKPISDKQARMSVRFESVDVEPKGKKKSMPVCFDGRVLDVLFLGSVVEIKAATDIGDVLAHVPAGRASALGPGAIVSVGFNPAEATVFGTQP